MGTPLTGSSVASTYTALLKTTDNAVLSGSLRTISDGGGNDSALQLSTTGVASTGTLAVTGATNLSTLSTSGNTVIGGALNVTGATTLTGNLSVPGTLSSTGNFSVNTNKFTVDATSGNAAALGTLSCTGNLAVNGTKFFVTAASGNTSVEGTLGVTGATSLSSLSTSGAATVGTTLGVTGSFSVATNRFTVDASNGNTLAAGTLNATGNFEVGAAKFTVAAASGNTAVAGTLDVTGNTAITGDLAVNGNTTIGNASGDSLTITAGTVAINNLTSKATPIDADTILIRDSAASNALKTSTIGSLNSVKFVYSEGFSKTGGAGQSASITTGSPTAIQEGGSASDWTYTWTPKTVGNKALIRVSVPIEVAVQGSMYIGVAKSPYSAPNDYIGVGAAYISASAASPANVIADMVFTSTAASHTFKIFVTGATQTVVIARNSFGYYFGQTGSTLQGKVQFDLIEFA
jgi:hypothetical protein